MLGHCGDRANRLDGAGPAAAQCLGYADAKQPRLAQPRQDLGGRILFSIEPFGLRIEPDAQLGGLGIEWALAHTADACGSHR